MNVFLRCEESWVPQCNSFLLLHFFPFLLERRQCNSFLVGICHTSCVHIVKTMNSIVHIENGVHNVLDYPSKYLSLMACRGHLHILNCISFTIAHKCIAIPLSPRLATLCCLLFDFVWWPMVIEGQIK